MKDIQQIQLIINSLQKDKEKHLHDLSRLNHAIFSRESMIAKMCAYQNDYLNNYNLNLSKTIPGLNQNITLFVKKIALVISQAEQEVREFNGTKKHILDSVQALDRKIDLMKVFEQKSLCAIRHENEKQEQNSLDDLASNMDKRKEYE